MSNLIKRLRGQRLDGRSTDETMLEAADEIERLRRENGRLKELLRDWLRFDHISAPSLAAVTRAALTGPLTAPRPET